MSSSNAVKRELLAMGVLVVGLNVFCLYDIFRLGSERLIAEGGFVENATAFCALASAFVLFFSFLSRRGFDAFLTLVFGSGCLMFFLREVDVQDYLVPIAVKTVVSGMVKDVLFAIWFCALFVRFLLCHRNEMSRYREVFKSAVGRILLFSFGCFVVAEVVEKGGFIILEELLEMTGGFFVLLAALLHADGEERLVGIGKEG